MAIQTEAAPKAPPLIAIPPKVGRDDKKAGDGQGIQTKVVATSSGDTTGLISAS